MNCESSFSFGKTASTINEAYVKMYATSQNLRTINEADDDFDPDDVEEIDAAELSGDFDADSEYDSIVAAERRQKEIEDLEGGAHEERLPDTGTKLDAKASADDDEESEENKTMPFSRLKFDDETTVAAPEFHFTIHRGTSQRYPEYLRAAAAKHGYKLPDEVPQEVRTEQPSGESKEDIFYKNVILANPEEFNEKFYDMAELDAHHKEIFDGFEKWREKYDDIIKATKMALEEIPGCERKMADFSFDVPKYGDKDSEDDSVGDIDDPTDTFLAPNGGFSAIIKYYDPRETATSNREKLVKYVNVKGITGKTFASQDEAAKAIRDELTNYVDEPSKVYVGAVLSNDLIQKLLHGNGREYERDEDGNIVRMGTNTGVFKWGAGKRKIKRINPTVYRISSSNKALTDLMLKRENNFKNMGVHCDEYLGGEEGTDK